LCSTGSGYWPYSSVHRYVRQAIMPMDWAGGFGSAEVFDE